MNQVIEIYWYTPIVRKLIIVEKLLVQQEQEKRYKKIMSRKLIKLQTISDKYNPEIEKLLKKLEINT